MEWARLPIYFQGRDTGLTAKSKADAAMTLHVWLGQPGTPKVNRLFCPSFSNAPGYGRLRKHTQIMNGRFEVGLGIPDRRKKPDKSSVVPDPGCG